MGTAWFEQVGGCAQPGGVTAQRRYSAQGTASKLKHAMRLSRYLRVIAAKTNDLKHVCNANDAPAALHMPTQFINTCFSPLQ